MQLNYRMVQLPNGMWLRADKILSVTPRAGSKPTPAGQPVPPGHPIPPRVIICLTEPKIEHVSLDCQTYEGAVNVAEQIAMAVIGEPDNPRPPIPPMPPSQSGPRLLSGEK